MTNYNDYIKWRRLFHQYPEVSNNEYETTKRLKQILQEYDIKIIDISFETGFVAEVGKGEPCIAVRTDIDALPIQEQVEHDFASTNEGAMHACGHDIHMASILAVATKLKAQESTLKGRVKFLFQPAEEMGTGALAMAETNALDDVKAIVGFHNYPTLEIGEFAIKSGPITSAVDRFEFKIHGKGAHAAKPEQGNDPVMVLGQLIPSLQTIVSRNISAFDSAVVTIGEVSSGNTWNVIADSAYVQGTVRSFKPEVQNLIEQRMTDIAKGLEQLFNVEIELIYTHLPQAVMNDEKLTEQAKEAAKKVGYKVIELDNPYTIGEDFSGLLANHPGVFAFIGSNSEYDLHHPKYDPDERILEKVPEYFITLIHQLLAEYK
ncbi:amidohydrolase [Staphylococcus sp. NRL 16/872]|uniref:amidohydrolase n=1 Tax=Staphylococcus sp. NRL 16/872 TaxID=2930131 RepID=UPI001FB434FA|nr:MULTISPECIES: amidohydrolase [unclassified Staphylococcus]MCJ1655734.1 amidohydrolase [Staphylococcus sp. NRL 21/187]WEN69948.1 amidohydrolase [Staphylococcus sp. NRL 16/872]